MAKPAAPAVVRIIVASANTRGVVCSLASSVGGRTQKHHAALFERATLSLNSSSTSDAVYSSEQTRALAIFGLDRPGDAVSIKQRYKELVKRYHPDAKGADASSDEKIKDVNQAYKVLMDFIGS